MQRQRTSTERVLDKTFDQQYANKLMQEYSLSAVEARTLTADIKQHLAQTSPQVLREGEGPFHCGAAG